MDIASYVLALFDVTVFRAIASCSSIWFWRCFSRFDSISSVLRSPRMAFLGESFPPPFAAVPPPNRFPQPQPDAIVPVCAVKIWWRLVVVCQVLDAPGVVVVLLGGIRSVLA